MRMFPMVQDVLGVWRWGTDGFNALTGMRMFPI